MKWIAVLFIIIGGLVEFLSVFFKGKKSKIVLATCGFIVLAFAATINQYLQSKEDSRAEVEKIELKATIDTLSSNLISARDSVSSISGFLRASQRSNDSLKIATTLLDKQNQRILSLIAQTKSQEQQHFTENQQSISGVSERFGQRFFNTNTAQKLSLELKPYKSSVSILLHHGTTESIAFSNQLKSVFQNAGFSVTVGINDFTPMVQDIYLDYKDGDKNSEMIAKILAGYCNLLGYSVKKGYGHYLTNGTLQILIAPYTAPAH